MAQGESARRSDKSNQFNRIKAHGVREGAPKLGDFRALPTMAVVVIDTTKGKKGAKEDFN
jgi:hypothetical protein